MIEIEIRTLLKENDVDKIIFNLQQNGFNLKKQVTQHDIYFDKPDAKLFKSGRVIRLRIENDKKELTYKGSIIPSDNIVTKRKEINLPINDCDNSIVVDFISSLGYPILFQVKKQRQIYTNGKIEVSIDDWPIIGPLMEIEGPENEILILAKEVAPNYIFNNDRLKNYFLIKMKETNKSLRELIDEYKKNTGFDLGHFEISLEV